MGAGASDGTSEIVSLKGFARGEAWIGVDVMETTDLAVSFSFLLLFRVFFVASVV